LTNLTYLGMTKYREEVHPGEHPAIVDEATFRQVQATLARNDANGGACTRNASGSWLKGLLRCGVCSRAMTPSHSTRQGKRYRYYRCAGTLASGREACPGGSVPAGQIEGIVLQRIRMLGTDPTLQAEVLEQARRQAEARQRELAGEERGLERDLTTWSRDLLKLSARLKPGEDNGTLIERLADLQQRIGNVEARVKKVKAQVLEAQKGLLDEDQAAEALALFDPLWERMTPREQARVVALLVEAVVFDGTRGRLSITFAPTGITGLAEELTQHHEQQRA
jgi:site-specific DNA recombinase